MQNFQNTLETRKGLFISVFSICMTVPLNEEDLAENVTKFPFLYDKSYDEFHRKDITKNAWIEVVESIGTEDGRLCLQ